MRLKGELIKIDGDEITFKAMEDINIEHLRTISRGKKLFGEIDIIDNDKKTNKQNALSHVLIADIARWSGDVPEWIEMMMKYYYKIRTGIVFSHSNATKEEINNFIHFLIHFILKNNIQLAKRYEYLLEYDYWFYYCLKYRICCLSGQPNADIHHAESIGMGNDRRYMDHSKFPLVSLSRENHEDLHKMGNDRYIKLHHIKPIFLSYEDLNKLGLMSQKLIDEIRGENDDQHQV